MTNLERYWWTVFIVLLILIGLDGFLIYRVCKLQSWAAETAAWNVRMQTWANSASTKSGPIDPCCPVPPPPPPLR